MNIIKTPHTITDTIEPTDQHKFDLSLSFPGWLEFTPTSDNWVADLDCLRKYSKKKIIVKLIIKNSYFENGFAENEINIIKEFSNFRGLEICSHFADLSFLEQRSQLEYLRLFGLVNHDLDSNALIDLDFTRLEKLKFLGLPIVRHHEENYNFQCCSTLEHLFWPTHYKANSSFIESLGSIRALVTLSMHRPKFTSLNGIGHLQNLEYLEIDYAKNLTDFADLADCSSLIGLELQNCPNISDLSSLRNLKNLKILQITNCKNIRSLDFLRDSNLEYLNFHSSNIKDGDLQFISRLQQLKILRFQNKQHYNKRLEDFTHFLGTPSSTGSAWEYYNYP